MSEPDETLHAESTLQLLSSQGPIAAAFKGYHPRLEQQEMMRHVLEAYNGDKITLIEAGTGTGKSLAYLLPAILWAAKTKERTIISTNTITLQEQLLHKDIPLVLKALKLDMKALIVKGMQNYLCLRKLHDAQQEILLFSPQEAEELNKIDAWKASTPNGSRSSLPFAPSPGIWEKVAAENDLCNRTACPYYQECHFFKARRHINEAQILIVNHHLLFADLAYRKNTDNYKDTAILPACQRIILDEAHNIEDIATEYFASRISQLEILRLLGRLTAEKGDKTHGKLPLLKEKLASHGKKQHSKSFSSIHQRLTIELPNARQEIQRLLHQAFIDFSFFVYQISTDKHAATPIENEEGKLRLLPHHYTHPYWKENTTPQTKKLCEEMKRYAQSLKALVEDLKIIDDPKLEEQIKGILYEIDALGNRLSNTATSLESFIEQIPPGERVRWIEIQQLKTLINTTLSDAELDVSRLLAEFLFSKFSTVVLCSATLTTNQQFDFVKERLGLNQKLLQERSITEAVFASPFNYSKQALFAIPTDIPAPNAPTFTSSVTEKIWQIVQVSRGNAFILFTSYSMLKACYESLEQRLINARFHPLKQGDQDRNRLLNMFKSTDRSVLFGTDSFWEGVDVTGEALRCVIIAKLPFKVPTEPLIEARSEAITAKGGDPFMEYSLPQAIVKFKQGFGRLIRTQQDRGCIVCLDNRIIQKRYGTSFLNSLPACQKLFLPTAELIPQMQEFYRKTYALTKSS